MLLDWYEVSEYNNGAGRVVGVVTEEGQSKVRITRVSLEATACSCARAGCEVR